MIDYQKIIEDFIISFDSSAYSEATAARLMGVNRRTLRNWIKEKTPSIPNHNSIKKVIEFMPNLKDPKNKRIKKHRSYGYVTQDQWDQLCALGLGPDRNILLKQIEKQNKSKGKTL